MLSAIASTTRIINDEYSNILLVILALLALLVAYNELILKKRPFVDIKLKTRRINDDTYFDVVFVNKGQVPGKVKVSSAELKIGDERYPTVLETTLIQMPHEENIVFPIGHVKKVGFDLIKSKSYVSNTCEIKVEAISGPVSRFFWQDEYPYSSFVHFKIIADESLNITPHLIENKFQ
jgi:hypothetical protein